MTGGRLGRVRQYLQPNKPFFMTYGDGVGDIDIAAQLDFHQKHGKKATMTGVQPGARFGALDITGDTVNFFREKPKTEGSFINGGYFVLNPTVLDLIPSDDTVWEHNPLESMARAGDLKAYLHHGFWQPMDTLRDKEYLQELWDKNKAPWKVWDKSRNPVADAIPGGPLDTSDLRQLWHQSQAEWNPAANDPKKAAS